jgi:hypothetical protein
MQPREILEETKVSKAAKENSRRLSGVASFVAVLTARPFPFSFSRH